MGGSPNDWNPNNLCELGTPAKFQKPWTTPSGRKVCDPEDEKKEKYIPKIVNTTFCCNAQGQCPYFGKSLKQLFS